MKTPLLTSIRILLLSAALGLPPCFAQSAAPAELLEKAIYTEETKGDLDGAIAIYQQLTAAAKTSQSLAAQAQFRLGQCYLKKKSDAEATAAFEKLIHDYPNQKELVAKARTFLPAAVVLGPVTWADGERLQYNLTLAAGTEIGAMETRADLTEVAGKKVWRVGRRMSGGGESVSSVEVDPETFQPLTSMWKHTLLGEVSAVYRPNEVELWKRLGAAAYQESVKMHLDELAFDNEECFHLMRRLPLQVGYKVTLPVVATLMGGGIIPLGCEIVKKETIEVPAGKFDCFKLQLSIGQTLWYSDDAQRYPVKFEAGGAIGSLASIAKRQPDAPLVYRDDALGLSFTVPAGWVAWRPLHGQPKGEILIRTYDSAADAEDGGMRLVANDTLPAAWRTSARAWAEGWLRDHKDLIVRPGSWKNYNVSGRVGVGCIVDSKDGDKVHTRFFIVALGAKTSELFVIASQPEKFDGLKAALEQIVASYRMVK